jgi:peptidoglycan/xylan/chitin deacetylase (PgdA/CDA1 family)
VTGPVARDGAGWPTLQKAVERAAARPPRLRRVWQRVWRGSDAELPPGLYVLAFHSVVDPSRCEPWEAAYGKVAIPADAFDRLLGFAADRFVPLRLSEALALAGQPLDRRYVVVTFDDGYTNNLTIAAPAARKYGLHPAVFVNGAFAEGRVYYRVLAALLTASGGGAALAAELRRRIPMIAWSTDGPTLFDQTKNHYVRGEVESAVDDVYRRLHGDPAGLRVHLTAREALALAEFGWEFGNHTYAHDVLSGLSQEQVAETIEQNERYWAAAGLPLVPCVAFPNGAARHVGASTHAYLRSRPELHGMFCNGGDELPPRGKASWAIDGDAEVLVLENYTLADFIRHWEIEGGEVGTALLRMYRVKRRFPDLGNFRLGPHVFDRVPLDWIVVSRRGAAPVLIGHGITLRTTWDGQPASLRGGWQRTVRTAYENLLAGRQEHDTLVGLFVKVEDTFRERGWAGRIVQAMSVVAQRLSLPRLIIPLRLPTLYEREHVLKPFEEVAYARRKDGQYCDHWLRLHVRLGATVLGHSLTSHQHALSVDDFHGQFEAERLSASGYVAARRQQEWYRAYVDLERDCVVINEGCVWVQHPIDRRS